MYDPTIFDNLKVAFENRIYDLDTVEEQIDIRNRRDVMDFALMSREFSLRFVLRSQPAVEVEVILRAGVQDLAGEIMDDPASDPASSLLINFYKQMAVPTRQCPKIEHVMQEIWEEEIELTQTLSYVFGAGEPGLQNTIGVVFIPRLTEENMKDINPFLDHVLEALSMLDSL